MTPNGQKKIYLLYSCDIWKSRDSMRLLMATTSKMKMKLFIQRKIGAEEMEYPCCEQGVQKDMLPRLEVALFRKDFENETIRTINDKLRYGFLDYVIDGEEI